MSSYQARVAERDAAHHDLIAAKKQLRKANEENQEMNASKGALAQEIERLTALLRNTVPQDTPPSFSEPNSTQKTDRSGIPEGCLLAVKQICYNPKEVLGEGCSGTRVFTGYCGTYFERRCAVKKLNLTSSGAAKKEVEALLKIDAHPNIVKYYSMEENDEFIFIALEMCHGNLEGLVRANPSIEKSTKRDIVRQMLCGLQHLHSIHMTHRDIKPTNVLYIHNADSTLTIKLADLGFAQQLDSSTQGGSVVSRSQGWQPAEVLDYFDAVQQRCTPEVVLPKPADIFSMGLVIFQLFSQSKTNRWGVHVFGGGIKCEPNISSNRRVNLDSATSEKFVSPEVEDLVVNMITFEPSERARISDCVQHPALWEPEVALEFLCTASDAMLSFKATHGRTRAYSDLCTALQAGADGKDWRTVVDPRLLAGSWVYDSSVVDLIRNIRNKTHHFLEVPADLRRMMGNTKIGLLQYFIHFFPNLFITVFKVMLKWYCTPDPANFDQ
eukprot:gene16699-19044_t